ncbi:substrate-binding domain-containing protein [Haloferula sp. A504]|uniref:substrate-binding domain-containing protein n=1 Tax=Haloferula sp. A504 TaxID=3373601 RepID=UPI0031CB0068|nr:substrate-binding domain-containing protein [Verrucomicrobiaceae bacterium E54]
MQEFRVRNAAEQVADHLRKKMSRGTWGEWLPGSARLAEELGVGNSTIETALGLLERQGLLESQGAGRRRKIVLVPGQNPPSLRIRVLLYQRSDEQLHYTIDLVHRLREAGHEVTFASHTLTDLRMDVERVRRLVQKTSADAWVVGSGPRPVLEWFSKRPEPTFSLLGRRANLPIAGAGPDKAHVVRHLVQRLVGLGHRRIVLLAREERRKPQPGRGERRFLSLLNEAGIPTGPYNLPDWDESPGSLQKLLDSLFAHTPPTALVVEEMALCLATLQHLANRGIVSPRQVSVVCDDPDPAFEWYQPSISHIHWDARPLVRRTVKWADNVARGKDDRRQTAIKARFVEGGTIGPAP